MNDFRNMEGIQHGPHARTFGFVVVILNIASALVPFNHVLATHEADHRFVVEGRVCESDGQGIEAIKVVVKDTRNSVTAISKTDGDGYYRTVLHLHNENHGDPLLIKALKYEETARVEFNSDDSETDRGITVNLGGPCTPNQGWKSPWVYYGIGAGLVGVAGLIGAKAIRQKTGKTPGKPKGKRGKEDKRRKK